jgi:hypothetical protein
MNNGNYDSNLIKDMEITGQLKNGKLFNQFFVMCIGLSFKHRSRQFCETYAALA